MKDKEEKFVRLAEAMVFGSDQAIRNQEKMGQDKLVSSEILPKDMSGDREKFETMGIEFGEDYDDIFISCILPAGWKKEPTDHPMWSNLVDDKDRIRASIFYKAAFYDRSAKMHIERRYRVSSYDYCDKDGNIVDYKSATHFGISVRDGGKIIKTFGLREKGYGNDDVYTLEKEAFAWLKENYPDYNNPLAYWD